MRYDAWPPYVPVAKRREKARKQVEKLKKKGRDIQPVELVGRKIAVSFWGKGWCDHMESFSDYANRLPRGRSYVRNGSVCHLAIQPGRIEAIVSGSSLYNVVVSIAPLTKIKWDRVRTACSGRIGSLIDLLRGKLEHGVMEVVADRRDGLFPLPGEMQFSCDCPDWADMCKHVAAVLYGAGARLDHSPELLFLLRGVNHEELVNVSAAVTSAAEAGSSRRRIATTGLADVFGIDLAEPGVAFPSDTHVTPARQTKKSPVSSPGRNKLTRARQAQAKTVPFKIEGNQKPSTRMAFAELLTGEAIHAWRLSLGETQAVFAARIGVTAASICQWESKGTSPLNMQQRTRSKLARAWAKAQHQSKQLRDD